MGTDAVPGPMLSVNGKSMELGTHRTIGDLLAGLEISPMRVVVEHNGEIHRRGEGLERGIAAGDTIEIVHFVGGG